MRTHRIGRSTSRAVVVITGASSGIGRATALAFAERGANVVLAAREVAALERVALECAKCGGTAFVVPTDVRVAASVEAVRELFETNVIGVLHGSQAAVAQFREQADGGVLVNIGSLAGEITYAKAGAYCASKHAVHAITEALRQEVVGTNIDVCLVAPPSVDTPLFQHSANFTGRLIVALPPLIAPERVAQAILRQFERPRRRVIVGAFPKVMIWAWRLLPRLVERAQPRVIERRHLSRQAAPKSIGNIEHSMAPHAITGGWEPRQGHVRGA